MNADRWKQVADCYRSAMERPAAERPAFLAQACANDPELRREVESLLAQGPADELLASPVSGTTSRLPTITEGHVLRPIGRGDRVLDRADTELAVPLTTSVHKDCAVSATNGSVSSPAR